ncbi:DUF2837 family protein [Saccharibacillus sp. CPCC 101409]|uniref:lipid II flippase family protein n=1 Tax=Saccharibacillus sp. CPCC 101409 TaxID=3058041 RepID=UPI002672C2F9|nr:DUF2837 family protein [Saccharibacillus sp. CPCC 101409]MDO3410513.1 DUF2837 family protein [Saccharibacillus sp. CPCC 101409]
MLNYLIIVFILTLIIHTAETLSYSLRYAGVRIGKIAVALSLAGILVLVSRTANMIQAPLTAKLTDYAKINASFDLLGNMRIILLAASLGTLIAMLLFPTFVLLWGRVIAKLEVAGSLPKLVTSVTVGQLRNTRHYIRKPSLKLSEFRILGISKRFIAINVIVTAVYTVGVLSALYASHLIPELATTASQSSGLINGVATILLTVFIDPQIGLITDKALNDETYRDRLGKIYVLLMASRLAGTLLAQLLLLPAAYFIVFMIKLI